MWPFKLHHALAAPGLLQQLRTNGSHISCRDHLHRLVERLQKTVKDPFIPRRTDVPLSVLHFDAAFYDW